MILRGEAKAKAKVKTFSTEETEFGNAEGMEKGLTERFLPAAGRLRYAQDDDFSAEPKE